MTKIYCVKCRNSTDTKSEKRLITENGRHRLSGICSICDSKKNMFVGKNWKVTKSREELDKAKEIREINSYRKKAEKIGLKVLENDAEDCVKQCMAKIRKQNK